MKFYLTILLIPLFIFISCTQDEPTKPESENKNIYTNGAGEIDSEGGEVSVSDNTSPIYNAKVTIPAGALSNAQQIKLSNAENDITFPGDSTAVVIKLEPQGLNFNKPVQVTLPVDPNANMSNLIAYHLNPDSQSVTQIPITNFDVTNNLASFETTHFSYFSIDDDGVHANVDMYYYDSKVSVSVYVDGYYYGRNLGLAGIRTLPIAWVTGFFNAQEVVDEAQYFISGNSPSEILEVALYKKRSYWTDKLIEKQRLWLVRTGNDASNLGADLYLSENNNDILLYSLQNQNSDDRGIWFKGEPLIFHFSNSVEQSSGYYIKAKWAIGGGPCFNIALCGRSTEVYEVTNYDYAVSPNQMLSNNPDEDNNYVIDSYQVNDPPAIPSNPNPVNNATEVSTSTTLSWECSDPDGGPLTYDIYFGTSSNPSLVKSNNTSKSYEPGSLNENTTYYWKIVAKDDQSNSATSSIWKFTTAQGNQSPATPGNPNPVDNATEVSTSTTLSWECSDPDGDPLTYDIYFGTSSNPSLVKSNHTAKNYDPGSLNENTTYYWKIIAKDDQSNSATSSIWKFTTAQGNQPPASPSNPNPEDNATEVSTSTTLSWECSDPDGDSLTYDIYFGTSSNPSLVKSNHTAKNYDPGSLNENTTYYWKIIAKDDKSNTTTSGIWAFTTWEEVSMGEPCPGIPTVTYEGKTYNTVLIVNQCWLKENLDVGTMIQGNEDMSDNGVIEKYCYDNDPANCETYGGLYQWDEVMRYSETEGAQGICPEGWHIPSLQEFEELRVKANNDGNSLKAIGEGYENGAGTNTSGFSVLLVGYRDYPGNFINLEDGTFLWSSSSSNNNLATGMSLNSYNTNIDLNNYTYDYGYSIRCLKGEGIIEGETPDTPILNSPSDGATDQSKAPTLSWYSSNGADSYTLQVSENSNFTNYIYNENVGNITSKQISSLSNNTQYFWRVSASNTYGTSSWSSIWSFVTEEAVSMGEPCPGIPTITYEGKTYNTVLIGEQCWLKENLDIGTMIQGSEDMSDNGNIEKHCYDNDPTNCETYGGLYQWDEAMEYTSVEGAKGLCPSGWHVPTNSDFEDLAVTVNGNSNALKAIGYGSGFGTGTNESGFSALLEGFRNDSGNFWYLGVDSYFWHSTQYATQYDNAAYLTRLIGNNSTIYNYDHIATDWSNSIRCLKD